MSFTEEEARRFRQLVYKALDIDQRWVLVCLRTEVKVGTHFPFTWRVAYHRLRGHGLIEGESLTDLGMQIADGIIKRLPMESENEDTLALKRLVEEIAHDQQAH